MTEKVNLWPEVSQMWRPRDPSPFKGDDSNEGVRMPPTKNEQPMPEIYGDELLPLRHGNYSFASTSRPR